MNTNNLEKLVITLYCILCAAVCMYPANVIRAFAETHGYKSSMYIFAFSWVLLTLLIGLVVLTLINSAAGKD